MLNIISSVTYISFIIIDIHTIMSLRIVSRMYGRKTGTYPLRKQCLMFMLLLAASEYAEKDPLEIKFEKMLSSPKYLVI